MVDSREPPEIKTPFVRAGWLEQALPSGDFCFYDSVGEAVLVERKTTSQLITDLKSGQLQRQARVLAEATIFPILLVEGQWLINSDDILFNTRVTRLQVWNTLHSLQNIGLRIERSTGIDGKTGSIERIFELEKYYGKEFHSSISRHPSGDTRLACLSLVHAIGQNKG